MTKQDTFVSRVTKSDPSLVDRAVGDDGRGHATHAAIYTPKPMWRTQPILRNFVICAFFFALSVLLAEHPEFVDRALAVAINKFAMRYARVDLLSYWLAYPSFQGILIVSSIYYAWFACDDQRRAHLILGVTGAVVAGVLANVLQHVIVSSPKPLFDPILGLHAPAILDLFNTGGGPGLNLHTFPSPRATLYSGIAIAVLLVRPKFGVVVLACTAVPELARVFLGLHYPNDIVGSFLLAAAFVWFAQLPALHAVGSWAVNWSIRFPASFYFLFYVACFEISSTFEEMRLIAQHVFAR